jgi:hypothetical protein
LVERSGVISCGSGLLVGFLFGKGYETGSIWSIPRRDTMPPPKLPRDAPVPHIFKPVAINGEKPIRHNLYRSRVYGMESQLSEGLHPHKPLFG